MADLFDLLQSQVSDTLIGAISNDLGGNAQPQQTSSAVTGAMSILMGALAKNAAKPDGAAALGAALDRDHDGSILDDLTGFINGSSRVNNTQAANGAGILGHILGANQGDAVEAISKMSGLDTGQSSNLLVKLAPIVMGMLGKQRRSTQINNDGLANILAGAAGTARQKAPNPSLITQLLDRDGDGSIKDEAASVGFSILKSLFKRKR